MCGIFGVVDWDGALPPTAELCGRTNLLAHRGPDDGGYWEEPGVFLGHRRLAIIDLSTGWQPMASADARHVITFNGEIYNYRELRDELRGEGVVFSTSSDTEVILAGYARWGAGVFERLEGMFAFALYDRRERTLLLARDRFGEKPLLVADTGRSVTFASELAPLVSSGTCRREIDLEALAGYLSLNYVPGTRTMLRGVERIAPGEWRLYGASGLRRSGRFWSPPPDTDVRSVRLQPDRGDDDALLDELERRVDRAVELTLRSDVPVGLFLSGGVDSSVVAHSAAAHGRLAAAFCVDFAEQGFSEFPAATRVAKRLNIDLVRVPLDVRVLDEFLDVAGHLDDPLADSSAMAVWTVARAASRHVKVVLSGDGGDELFGGYLTYLASQWHARLHWLPRPAGAAAAAAAARMPVNGSVKVGAGYKLHRFLRALPLETAEAHFTWNGTWLPAEAATLVRGEEARRLAAGALRRVAGSHALGSRPSLHALQSADLHEYLPNDILAKVDRATMAHGLESRAPLLNGAVAALALTLPVRLRAAGRGRTKVLLRRLCERQFGSEHAYAPKQGFSLPIHAWLRGYGRDLVTRLLSRERVEAIGVLDADAVTRAVDAHLSGARALGWEIWGLMVLSAWHDARVVNPPRPAAPGARALRPLTLPTPVVAS